MIKGQDMCEKKNPNARDFLSNFKVSSPLSKKLTSFIKNNVIKIKTRKNCCGNLGEPGC